MNSTLQKLVSGGLSVGLELPLDNDWNSVREQARQRAGMPFGVPDLAQHARLATLADRVGFRALWVRDVPLYDPQFGDAAQVFEVFTYLGYLAGVTRDILLGTAAVVLPIREPLLTMKAAASVDLLSGGRLLLGVASGDRPVEYPLFGRDFDSRGEAFRAQVALLREWRSAELPPGVEVLPRPVQPLPLLVAGLAQQSPAWVGEHLDGWLAYPGTPQEHVRRAGLWREVAGEKPYVSFIHLDLDENPDAPLERHRFGCKVGRNGLIAELQAMRAAGVAHIGLHLRRNRRPLDETLEELGAFVLPTFHGKG
ncbi:TIGR03571 family LLM class oxidoreductase [Pseudomonas entomophila]|uniref:TIGR03571 family LLM class oxidoreductase n=1 Tax=Pseudomonas entomophila TaxID=312306 RepID=UPI0023D7E944|nr:TIGR03571 family LLM class oxidoreductase [Pseudomonas entomophila]MDF0729642.1 TIGR03571 family LLM class oxidoreductase [Pseudomonas entomophila]